MSTPITPPSSVTEPAGLDHSERRKHLRHEVATAAQSWYDQERRLLVSISDLSYEGLCIEAGSDELMHMLPPLDDGAGCDNVPLRVSFQVLLAGEESSIRLLASTAWLHTSTEGRGQLGLEIVDVEQGVLELSEYIAGLN